MKMNLPTLISLSTAFLIISTLAQHFPVSKSTPAGTLILPLKTPSNKLPFTHNVTLTVSLAVGNPPQNVTMVLDTGSELSYLQCNTTPTCRPVFDPNKSLSYAPVPCSSPTCTIRTQDFSIPASCDSRNLCHAILSYADASSSEGNLAADNFAVAGSDFPGTIFGCMVSGYSSNSGEDSKTTGLMGMNRGSLSFVSQMGFKKFSYCISASDYSGILLFGDSNATWILPLNYTPLIQIPTPLPYFNRVAYTVQLEGIKVSEKLLPLPKSVFVPDHTGAGQTMVDSGTQFTFLLGPAYTALRSEFLNQTQGALRVLEDPDFVFQGAFDLCFLVPMNSTSPPDLPSVGLMFRGAQITVAGGRLLYRVPGEVRGNDSVHCFTFGNSDLIGMEANIIGHHHQQNIWMEFDLEKSRIGVAQFISGLLLVPLSVALVFFLSRHIYLIVQNKTTIEVHTASHCHLPISRRRKLWLNVFFSEWHYHEGVRAPWLEEKDGQLYSHPYDIVAYENLIVILGPKVHCWFCPTSGHVGSGLRFQTKYDKLIGSESPTPD